MKLRKHRKAIERLSARIQDWEKTMGRLHAPPEGSYKKPGSMKGK